MREAGQAAGKQPLEVKLPRTRDQRAEYAVSLLSDKATNDRVNELLNERKAVRRMRQAATAAADERSAEYKEALSKLRRAQALKSPETAFLDVVFQIQKSAEFVRAVRAAEKEGGVPEHRKPDLLYAIEGLIDAANAARDELERERRGDSGTHDEIIDVDFVDRSRVAQLLELATEPEL